MKIGIDLGGSHVGVGLINGYELIIQKERNFTDEDRINFEENIFRYIDIFIEEILKEANLEIEDIELIGVAVPGIVQNGVLRNAGNLKIDKLDVKNFLGNKYPIKILVHNDAKAAGLAEKRYGAMKNYEDGVFISIGTGIGGAVFMNNQLLEPKRDSGFEMGHICLKKDGRQCSCGKKGCFEAYSSIKALKYKVTEDLGISSDITGQYLREELLILDNEKVKEDVEEFLNYLSIGICNFIDIFEPQVVCLGGSFAYYEGNSIYDRLLAKINEPMSTHNHNEKPKIVLAGFKNNAGIIGATLE